jgi:hypothetical protein
MELFEEVFHRLNIYDKLYFNVKAVLEFPTLNILKEQNPALYERWKYMVRNKYHTEARAYANDWNINITASELNEESAASDIYKEKAVYHPEFCKIIAITYGTLYPKDNGEIGRNLKKIINDDEYTIIATFMDVLHQLSSDAINSSPQHFLTFCGHNITNYDIPLLLKRYVLHRSKFIENQKLIPLMLKKCLSAKPWDSGIVDTVNVWKFGGNNYETLMLIADFLQIKKTVDVQAMPEMSREYWNKFASSPHDAQEYVALQSATQTNLAMKLMIELRQL